ncbi:hypothetical protein J2S63_003601 [Marmoricola bigeumensis]|uniref:Uncharacterized protein n=1 Tax=Nocardioides marmoribigeumensis TaxID=433649 RepID=A0ABU2C062_9ACTN|nr:hypothetical protein [Nocardioides marmoribigeumensis]
MLSSQATRTVRGRRASGALARGALVAGVVTLCAVAHRVRARR